MPTLNEMVYSIKNKSYGGQVSDDARISDRLIAYWIHQVRSQLIAQDLQKKKDLSDEIIQVIGCVPMSLVDASLCCEEVVGCTVLQSDIEIPATIDSDLNNMILAVKGLDGKSIIKTNPFRSHYNSYNKYTGQAARWFILRRKLYIINDPFIEKVSIFGVFDDPSSLSTITNSCTSESCFTYDSKYPVTLKMASAIEDIVLKTKVFPTLQTPTDTTNDASGQTQTPGNIKL